MKAAETGHCSDNLVQGVATWGLFPEKPKPLNKDSECTFNLDTQVRVVVVVGVFGC